MKSLACLTCFAFLSAVAATAGMKPVAFRLASLPASSEPGQKLMLCAANIGSGAVDVTLEFINVKTGGVVAEKTVSLQPLGAGAASQPCLATEMSAAPAPHAAAPMAASFASTAATPAADDGEALLVGVAMVRQARLSFRLAQVTASIQVMAPDENGVMHTVQTIPLSRAAHPTDGAPVNTAPPAQTGHHK